jgi:hypothetical protein
MADMNTPVAEPDIDDFAQLQEARAIWNRGERDAGLAHYRAAVAASPRNVRGLLEYARALGHAYRIAEAEGLLQQVRSLAGLDGRVVPPLAKSYQELCRPQQAIELLEAAREAKRLAPLLLGELALLYERSNQIDRAIAAIQECVAQAPGQPEPRLVLARLERRRGAVGTAETVLRELTATATGRPLLMVQAWTELCQLRDEQGDFDGAWDAIEQAKQWHRRFPEAEPMSRKAFALNATFRQLYEELDSATLKKWRSLDLPADPRCGGVAHLLGFPRTGTTLLEQCIGAHPRLVDSPERAVFTRDIFPAMHELRGQGPLTLKVLDAIPRERLILQRTRYLDGLEAIQGEPLGGRVHLDKNPNHTSLIAGLLRLFPESRFLFALRDPRDVLVSNYFHHFPLSEFGAGLLTPGSACLMYANDMNIWLRIREWLADQWLEVKYEDTVTDIQAQALRAVEFLGLPWDGQMINYRQIAEHKVVNSPSHDTVRQPVYTRAVARWKNYERQLGAYFERLTPYVRAFGYD